MNKNEIFSYLKQHANGTVLSFPERGPWGSSSYRGNFSGWIPAAIIYRYGAGSVSEIFAGGGTTSDLCRDLEIPYCGIDLNPAPVRNNILTMDILDEESELPDAFYEADRKYVIICTLPFKKTCRPSGRHILFLLFGSKSFW